jgi:carboxylesterase
VLAQSTHANGRARELSFDEAVQMAMRRVAEDTKNVAILPEAVPRLYTHGKPVNKSVVLFHGFTNCPQQFDELAKRLFDRGCNVYVPRISRHGLKDRMTLDLGNLTVKELEECSLEACRIGQGLGNKAIVMGLSLGGTMTLWLAQTQPIDLAVPIAPFLMPANIPQFVGNPAAHLLAALPDKYWFWDSKLKEKSLPIYAYPGYPMHGMVEVVYLADAIFKKAAKMKPQAERCVLVTNAGENAVNNSVAGQLLNIWNARGAGYRNLVLTNLGEPRHDIIDPTTYPRARKLVYPVLEKLVETLDAS